MVWLARICAWLCEAFALCVEPSPLSLNHNPNSKEKK